MSDPAAGAAMDQPAAPPDPDTLSHLRHELRTPVNAILGYSEMLIEDAEEEAAREETLPDLRRIHEAGKRLLHLINTLLIADGLAGPLLNRQMQRDEPSSPPDGEEPWEAKIERGEETARLLVVDDDEHNRDMLSRRLRRQGHSAAVAENGRRALEMLHQDEFDLVLLDIMMPEMNGFETLDRLKSDYRLRRIPVIMLSALSDLDGVVHCLERGADDYLPKPINPALLRARIASSLVNKRLRDQEQSHLLQVQREKARADALLNAVIPIGAALSAETDFNRLLERILIEAKAFCNADGGTLYLRTEDDRLRFVILQSDTLGIAMGGASGNPIPFPPLPLYDPATGEPVHRYVVTHSALTGETIHISDAYAEGGGFDFAGTRAFDEQMGYRSTSFLTVPLKNSLGRVIGVLQLLNAKDGDTGRVVPFDPAMPPIIEALSVLATVALEAYAREERLKRQIAELRIEIDETRKQRQVAEITETDYFQKLQEKARGLRRRERHP